MSPIRAFAWVAVIFLSMATGVWGAVCTTAADCTEWVAIGNGPERLLVYRSFPLETRNSQITRAVIVVHGAGRDADNYFRHMPGLRARSLIVYCGVWIIAASSGALVDERLSKGEVVLA